MFKKPPPPMDETQVQPVWEQLCLQERRMRRNLRLSRLLQPLGYVLFLLLLYPATVNLALALCGDTVSVYFEQMLFLPALVSSLPHGSVSGALVFLLLFSFLIPLALSALIFTATVLLERRKPFSAPPLLGSPTARARALVRKAGEIYTLRGSFLSLPVYPGAAIVTGLMAFPIVTILLNFAKDGDASPLYYALGCLALLLCLFILFWVFVLLFWCFGLLNALFFYSETPWRLYAQYQRLDAYWESIDPAEHEKRERESLAGRRRKKSPPPPDETLDAPAEQPQSRFAAPFEAPDPPPEEFFNAPVSQEELFSEQEEPFGEPTLPDDASGARPLDPSAP